MEASEEIELKACNETKASSSILINDTPNQLIIYYYEASSEVEFSAFSIQHLASRLRDKRQGCLRLSVIHGEST